MEHRHTIFQIIYTFILILLCLFLIAYSVIMSSLSFQISDTKISLETSLQRENKQRYEYDQVSAALPDARQTLDELLPQAESCTAEVEQLKAERKLLRAEKQSLIDQLENKGADSE